MKKLSTHIQESLNESVSTLTVFSKSKQDHNKINKWLEDSEFHAEETNNRNGMYFEFSVDGNKDADSLETALDKVFVKMDINVHYESQ